MGERIPRQGETDVPCLICGLSLERVHEDADMQPSDGIYCETPGNYGSTVFDPMDGEYLAFLICDPCMTRAGEQGRVMVYRRSRPVVLPMPGRNASMVIGREDLRNRPFIPWHAGLPHDDETVTIDPDEVEHLPASVHLTVTPAEIRRMAAPRYWKVPDEAE